MCRTSTILSLSGETLIPKFANTSADARLDITLPSLIVGGLIHRGGSNVNLTLVFEGGGNKSRWVDICETSLNWGYLIDWGDHGYVTNCKY